MPPPTVIAVFGPTGVGKTAVAVALAQRLCERGEDPVAVSADALQVYEGLPILTGAADARERRALEHRLIGFVPVQETFSAGAYARRAQHEIDELLERGRRPIVVGGTGLYLRAALADLELRPPVAASIRARYSGRTDLHEELQRRDPARAETIAPTDRHRLIRTLELLDAGAPLPPAPGTPSALWTEHTRHPTLLAALVMDRDALARRIDARIDAMLAAGVTDEVRRADAAGASATARAAVGFQELLDGDIATMRTRTRRYAKRQLTWLRKLPGAHLIDVTGRTPEHVAAELIAMI